MKLLFKRRDLREHFGVSNYKLDQMIGDGVLCKPLVKTGRHPIWARANVKAAEKRIDELNTSAQVVIKMRPLSEKQREQRRMYRESLAIQ